jgi:hypothetical protein
MTEISAAPRPHWLTEERLRVYSLLIVAICGLVFAICIARSLPTMVDSRGKPIGYDFITFWSAARLALDGRPEAAFDWAAIAAAQRLAVPGIGPAPFLWHYPPTFLLLVLPLGLLPYAAALIVFVGATVALWAGLVRALFRDKRAWLIAAATPAGLLNLLDGQNGFLTAGLAGFAMVQLDRQPRLAGMLIGMLAIKPHLAALFPLALIASRRWQALMTAAVTALAFTALGVAAFGPPTTLAFFHDLPQLRDIVDRAGLPWGQMPSPYVLLLSLHAPSLAATMQALAAIGAAVCVWLAWRNDSAPFEAKAAALFAGSMLVSPYLFTYDLTWDAVAIAFLAMLGLREGFIRGERDMLAAAWLAPLALYPLYWLTGVQLGCAVLMMLLAAAMRRATRPSSLPLTSLVPRVP